MQQPTQQFKRSLAGSVGAGMKSVFAGEGRRFYTLVHKVSSRYHQAGESQQIIVDQVEIGRDSRCQVRFDESFTTVSRRHAAIVKDGDNWKLVQLSKTNSTYLNGHKVQNEWYLQNGDEIQLSTNGPKLGFIIPEGKKGLVGSIGLTARLNLFRKQALRPYKNALWGLSCLLLAVAGISGYFLNESINENKRLQDKVVAILDELENEKRHTAEAIEQISKNKIDSERRIKELERTLEKSIDQPKAPEVTINGVNNKAIDACLPHIFFILTMKIEIRFPSGQTRFIDCIKERKGWSGTGFLLNDGRFITARHVAEGWYFWNSGGVVNQQFQDWNIIVNKGGKVIAHFTAISSSGEQLQFTSEQFHCNRSTDLVTNSEKTGERISLGQLNNTDYAYIQTSHRKGLKFSNEKSTHLERGTKLTVLGFPFGLGANAPDDISPIYGSGIVAAPGLQQGVILTTDTNYEQGNSGGPVFHTTKSGELEVVGIVSAGKGRVTGFVVPISAVR
ncbi:MAG: FHA domain-containing protein [Bacteroidales bacterium]|nr:FHA domain-containing protein [Bacteroidales bacterium]